MYWSIAKRMLQGQNIWSTFSNKKKLLRLMKYEIGNGVSLLFWCTDARIRLLKKEGKREDRRF